jgi:hypothetical protein
VTGTLETIVKDSIFVMDSVAVVGTRTEEIIVVGDPDMLDITVDMLVTVAVAVVTLIIVLMLMLV